MSRQQRVCARPCHALLAGKVVRPLLLRAPLAAAYPASAAPAPDLTSPSRDRLMGARGPASPGDLGVAPGARAQDLPDCRLKAALIDKFMLSTECPAETGATLNLCIHGSDPFGKEIDGLQGKVTAGRSVAVHSAVG